MLKIKNDLYFCCCCCFVLFLGIKGGAVVRALASHQCDLSSNPGLEAICWLSLLLVIFLALRGFSLGTPVFLCPWKPTLLNSNSTWSARTRLKDFLKPPKYFVGKQTNKYKLNYKCNFVCLFYVCLLVCCSCGCFVPFLSFLFRLSYYGKYVIMLLTMFRTLFQVFMSMKENNVMWKKLIRHRF